MKKITKLLALMLILSMSVFVFAACSEKDTEEKTTSETKTEEPAPAPAPTVAPAEKSADEEAVAKYVADNKSEIISALAESGIDSTVTAEGTRIKIVANITELEDGIATVSDEEFQEFKDLMASQFSTLGDEFKAQFGDGIKAELPELTGMDMTFTVAGRTLYEFSVDL